MAFASVISLKNIIERLLNTSKILLVPGSLKIMEISYNNLQSLQQILNKLDCSSKRMSRNRLNALDEQIKETVSKFEDLLESDLSHQISHQNYASKFSIELQHLTQDVNSFIKTAEKMEEDYLHELNNLLPQEEEEEEETAEFGESKMVGLSDVMRTTINFITLFSNGVSCIHSIFGMAGIGKTTLANEIFHHPLILSEFECRAWVNVGRLFKLNEIPRCILRQLVDDEVFRERERDDEKTTQFLYEFLKDKRYLIVLDDVWETEVLKYLRCCFPESNVVDGRILITTRLMEIHDDNTFAFKSSVHTVRLLNDGESWDLFREKVFGQEWCPPKLEEAGKKIVKNCDGLPLTITGVAKLLLHAGITVEYWNEVAADKEHAVFRDIYGEISKILSPSYEYLPQRLKPCFLYMGVVPQDYEFSRSKLIDMWMAEGFLVPKMGKTLEECGLKCLTELVSNSLVIVCEKSTILSREMKTCRLHASFWHFCRLEVMKNKFFTVLNCLADVFVHGLKGQRRLSIHNNILLGIKEVVSAIEDECALTARSLLCLGPYHHFPLTLCFGLRFLRVVRALSIRLYEFPMQVLELVQLRYLALTFDGDLPSSVSRLFNLQFLIIHRHLNIKSYVPVEIWDMQELIHLHIMGSDLPEPTSLAFLKNLRTLLDVSFDSCTKRVLQKISNLMKLGIRIALEPDEEIEPFHCLKHISRLHKLDSLKCVAVNPELKHEVVAPPAPLYSRRVFYLRDIESPIQSAKLVTPPARLSVFPPSLLKLHLSGLCIPWEYTDTIASLPNLEVLKLQCYAFQGPKWEIRESEYPRLMFLVIEDADLVEWKVGSNSFTRLRSLSIKHCYKLQDFDWDFHYYFKNVEIVDSNPLAEAFINQIKDRRGRSFLNVTSVYSWMNDR